MARWTRLATAVVGVVLLAGCGDTDETDETGADGTGGPTAQAPASEESPSAESSSVELSVPAAQSGRCMLPNVENLRAQDTAFEGTVTEVVEGNSTLQVSKMYAGQPVETVSLVVPGQDMSDLLLAVDFQEGQTYLVSSLDGQVSVCGLSGPKDELLSGLYQEAYAG